ncbi:hypothetical protein ACFLT1_01920 [Bacteroidota bacterium]
MNQVLTYLIAFLTMVTDAYGQKPVVFANQGLGIAFEATSQWSRLQEADSTVLELTNPNNNLSVRMWKESIVEDVDEYLDQRLAAAGMAKLEGPFRLTIDSREAYGIIGLCNELHRPIKTFYIVIPSKSKSYIVQIKCPEECYREHQKHIDELIRSIKLLSYKGFHSYLV